MSVEVSFLNLHKGHYHFGEKFTLWVKLVQMGENQPFHRSTLEVVWLAPT
jgi:hypothetical protein